MILGSSKINDLKKKLFGIQKQMIDRRQIMHAPQFFDQLQKKKLLEPVGKNGNTSLALLLCHKAIYNRSDTTLTAKINIHSFFARRSAL